MTLDEILKGIDALSSEDKAKLFEGKNKKLNEKDTEISKLKAKIGEYELKEKETDFNKKVNNILGTLDVKKDYLDTVKKLSDINMDDDDKTIKEKLSGIKKDDKYKMLFEEKTSVNTLFNNGLPKSETKKDNDNSSTSTTKDNISLYA